MLRNWVKMLAIVLAIGGTAGTLSSCATAPEDMVHNIVFQINDNDPKRMNLVLNNASNVDAFYKEAGEEVNIEIVAYGPGLMMYVDGKSPVADRISTMSLEIENLSFAACGNTHRKMSEKAGKEIALLDEASVVPSGVVRLIELQENGYAYVRP